jgi:hypothetical protein
MLAFCKLLRLGAALLLVGGLAGCGSGAGLVPVSGTLTYKGKAVANAYVDFQPETGRPSWGLTNDQGQFTLEFDSKHKGAVAGKHKVSVRRGPVTAGATEPGMPGEGAMSREMVEFFSKYSAEHSTKVVTIDKNNKDVKLDWD